MTPELRERLESRERDLRFCVLPDPTYHIALRAAIEHDDASYGCLTCCAGPHTDQHEALRTCHATCIFRGDAA